LNFSKAFAQYGATLKNVQWAVSAIADGRLIVSCWQHYFQRMTYTDRLSRFGGPGNNLLREHLEQAVAEELPVKAVIAYTQDRAAIDSGGDASKVKKSFTVKPDWTGKVVYFDGDEFRIQFQVAKP
jgi:hypothetical protein